MRNLKFFFASILLSHTALADTASVHFNVGDIAPRQKISVNMNPQLWPGYLDVKCDIIDPTHSAIIRISFMNSAEIIQINQNKYENYDLPIQTSLKTKETQLTFFKSFVYGDGSDKITFENLDDDTTISVKNCEVSPNAILSKELLYFPSAINCADNYCNMQGSSPDQWNDFTAPTGKYNFSGIIYINEIAEAIYYNYNYSASIKLTPKQKVIPFKDIYTLWTGGTDGMPVQCSTDVLKCPIKIV
jgi:hypothetical protein